jgi:ABC-type antimicrobial peptide transport system permease subunit
MPSVIFVVEHSGDPAVVRRVQEEILGVDRTLAITRVLTMEDAVDSEIGRFRVAATLVGFFSILALILASAGLYGVLSHMVARRAREIGIRVALGASVGEVGRGVLGRGLRLALWGIALGTAVSIAGTRLLTGFLYGVEPRDPITMVGVPIVLLFVAGLASVIPAWRATRVDPIEALRAD